MAEFLIGLFITTLLNGIWNNKDPVSEPRYWSKETENIWHKMDSTLFERIYEFDSTVYFFGDSAVMRINIPDTTANVQQDTLRLDGL